MIREQMKRVYLFSKDTRFLELLLQQLNLARLLPNDIPQGRYQHLCLSTLPWTLLAFTIIQYNEKDRPLEDDNWSGGTAKPRWTVSIRHHNQQSNY